MTDDDWQIVFSLLSEKSLSREIAAERAADGTTRRYLDESAEFYRAIGERLREFKALADLNGAARWER